MTIMTNGIPLSISSIGYCTIAVCFLISSCNSIPIGHRAPFPVPPSRVPTESPDGYLQFIHDILNGVQDGDSGGNFLDSDFFNVPTDQPPPRIPTFPGLYEDVNNLPQFFPTNDPFAGAFENTYEPTVYNDNSFYGSSVASSSFIAVAIAIVVILIISIVVTIYAIKGRRRNIIIMTIRRTGRLLERDGDYFQTLADGDRSLLVQPAPIVYMQDGEAPTPPAQVPEPPPYTEHELGETLLPAEMPPPYTAASSGNSTDNPEQSGDSTETRNVAGAE